MMHIAYSPYFHKSYKFPPTSANFTPNVIQFTFFCVIYVFCFHSYFDHDAFTGRPWLNTYLPIEEETKEFGNLIRNVDVLCTYANSILDLSFCPIFRKYAKDAQ